MKHIFIVEDERIIAMDLAKRLNDMGYKVDGVASSSSEAITQITDCMPDLILMDIVIKGELDGIATADRLRNLGIPVIYLTAYSDEKTLERAKLTEPFGYILKPFKDKEISSTIEMALYKSEVEKKLKESEELYRFLFDNYPEIYLTLDENHNIISANEFGADQLGYKNNDLFGKSINLIINDYDKATFQQTLEKVKNKNNAENEIIEIRMVTKDNTELWTRVRIKPSIRNDKKIFIIVCEDVTKLKLMEQKLIDTQKLESIGTLAGGIAHDFNNMLTVIMSNISLARLRLTGEEVIDISEITNFLSEAESNIFKTKDLTQQLLTFSKGGKPSKKISNKITQILSESSKFVTRGTNIDCRVYVKDKLWAVEIDEGQIGQVVNNIVMNASQSMPDGGDIYISVENAKIKDEDQITLKSGKYLKIVIKDKGIGIEKDKLSKIFDPYYTTKENGHGLGLSITYSIIKNHNGHIEARSEINQGTEFIIYLPAIGNIEVSDEDEKKQLKFSDKGRILFMDDEESIRDSAKKILIQLGHEVTCVKEGNELLEIYEQQEKNNNSFDLVIMDLTIKNGLGGLETIKKLIEKYPEAKAIVSSGYSSDLSLSEYKKHGFLECITKPYTVEEFSSKISNVLSEQ